MHVYACSSCNVELTDSRLFGVAIQMNTNTCVCRLNLFIYEVVVFFQGTSLFPFFQPSVNPYQINHTIL